MTNPYFEDKRLLEALNFIDERFIAEVTEDYEIFDLPGEYKPNRKRTFRAYRQFAALAACLILLSGAFPVVNYAVKLINSFAAGWGSIETELLDTQNTEDADFECAFTHLLTQTDVDNVNSAYKKYWGYDKGVFWISPEEVTFAKGERCTYGKYNDCIVIARRTEMDFVNTFVINEYEFILPACILWVCKDEELYDLTTAYDNGWLSDEAIKHIYGIHNNYMWGHLSENEK